MSESAHDVLDQAPVHVDDTSDVSNLEKEFGERLEALLDAHMLDASPDGWRNLACALALQYVPAFQIETPADRKKPGGRPVREHRHFVFRSMMKQEMNRLSAEGVTRGLQKRAAEIVGPKFGMEPSTANNAMSQGRKAGDDGRRRKYVWKADEATRRAALLLSSQK